MAEHCEYCGKDDGHNAVCVVNEVIELRAANARLTAALESLTQDPPATFAREPDEDAEVIIKMRATARAALTGNREGD